jgi:uroporphyrinogen III methyltransferase / synthase
MVFSGIIVVPFLSFLFSYYCNFVIHVKIVANLSEKETAVQNQPTPNQPLQDVCVMVTRPEQPSDPLVELLRGRGAEVIVQPAIRIMPPPDWQAVDDALSRLHEFDWLVFSSANGVEGFFERRRILTEMPSKGTVSLLLTQKSGQSSWTGRPRVAAMGPGTADALARYGIQVDRMPDRFDADALADALATEASGRRFLLARASRGREALAERLAVAGATVEQIVVYASVDVEQPDSGAAAMLRAGRIDWITVTSSAIARSLIKMFGEDLRRARLAAISPITGDLLRELGFTPGVEASRATFAALVEAIAEQK